MAVGLVVDLMVLDLVDRLEVGCLDCMLVEDLGVGKMVVDPMVEKLEVDPMVRKLEVGPEVEKQEVGLADIVVDLGYMQVEALMVEVQEYIKVAHPY